MDSWAQKIKTDGSWSPSHPALCKTKRNQNYKFQTCHLPHTIVVSLPRELEPASAAARRLKGLERSVTASLLHQLSVWILMANSLFLPNHTLVAPPPRILSASVSSKPNKPQPPLLPCPPSLRLLGFSSFSLTTTSSSSVINHSSGSSGGSGGSRRRVSSIKSRLTPQASVTPVSRLSSFSYS